MHVDTAELRLAERVLPAPDDVSRPFWAAAARGELIVQRCLSCRHVQHYPRAVCRRCAGDTEWITATGRGEVHTFTVVRHHFVQPYKSLVPYVLAMVRIEEGPLMLGNVIGCAPESVHITMPVEVTFAPVDDELAVPFWRPAG